MNSVRSYVIDAVGQTYCYSLLSNREDLVASEKRHCQWWMRTGYKSIPASHPRSPVKPFHHVMEEYQDNTAP